MSGRDRGRQAMDNIQDEYTHYTAGSTVDECGSLLTRMDWSVGKRRVSGKTVGLGVEMRQGPMTSDGCLRLW